MSNAARESICHEVTPLLGSYLDGELDTTGMHHVESHVVSCAPCHEHVELLRATRATLRKVVRKPAPEGLRGRLVIAMAAEAVRADTREAIAVEEVAQKGATRLMGWRTMVPLATAAALALTWGASTHAPSHVASNEHTAGFDLLSELLAEHSQPLPPEATDSRSVRNLSKYIGVPVRPTSFEKGGARLIGGRVVGASDRRAAVLQYVVSNGNGPGRRVSVLVYDPSKIQVNGPADLAPHAVGTAQVEVGHAKGYSVALAQRAGVGYAFASDLDTQTSAEFAANAYDE